MFEEILKRYLSGNNLDYEEEKMLLENIKNQVLYAINSIGYNLFKKIYFETDELVNEAVILIIDKKNSILKVINNDGRIESYIKYMIKNHLIDQLRKGRIQSEELKDEHTQKPGPKDELISIEAEEFAKLCKEKLTKAEKEALCFELLEKKPQSKTTASFEKAKSRAHKRIREFIEKEKFPEETVNMAVKRFFMSEICPEFVNMYEEQK